MLCPVQKDQSGFAPMPTRIDGFEHSLQLTNVWLKDLMARLGTDDRHLACLALGATLHALRDRLTVEETADLGAQLPMLVRGLYYEGWRPAGKPLEEHARDALLSHVEGEARNSNFEAEPAVGAAFGRLAERVRAGERDVKTTLPRPARKFWPRWAGVDPAQHAMVLRWRGRE
jgi:uncharacterized protein (DUF2267 family)